MTARPGRAERGALCLGLGKPCQARDVKRAPDGLTLNGTPVKRITGAVHGIAVGLWSLGQATTATAASTCDNAGKSVAPILRP